MLEKMKLCLYRYKWSLDDEYADNLNNIIFPGIGRVLCYAIVPISILVYGSCGMREHTYLDTCIRELWYRRVYMYMYLYTSYFNWRPIFSSLYVDIYACINICTKLY